MLVAALFTRMSICPKSRTVLSTSRCSSSSFPTWQAIGTTRPATPLIPAATCSSVSCLRPQMMTVAPSRANTSAMDCPIPRLPPVTIATLCLSWLIKYFASQLQTFQVGAKLAAQIVAAQRHLDGSLQEPEFIAGVVARAFEHIAVNGAIAQQVLQGIG